MKFFIYSFPVATTSSVKRCLRQSLLQIPYNLLFSFGLFILNDDMPSVMVKDDL
jgi:hypothetical protein